VEELANSERIRDVFDFTRSLYPWIVMILAAEFLGHKHVLGLSDLFLVATLEVAVLFEVRRVVSRLADIGGNRSHCT